MRAIQVRHGAVIAFAEALPIILTFIPRHMGVTEFFTIFNVRRAVIIKVLARALNSIMKALTLRFAKFSRRLVPVRRVSWAALAAGDPAGTALALARGGATNANERARIERTKNLDFIAKNLRSKLIGWPLPAACCPSLTQFRLISRIFASLAGQTLDQQRLLLLLRRRISHDFILASLLKIRNL